MQVVLHIGPHKTGTTSIQSLLKRKFGSESPAVPYWYPMPIERGPGHSTLACDLFDENGSALEEVILQANAAKTARLIISAEAFDRFYNQHMDRLVRALADHPLHLLVTLNSPIARAASSWQESVKHGNPLVFDEWLPKLLEVPGYQPDFVRRYTEALRPEKVSVVYSCREAPPHELLTNVLGALSLPIEVEGNGVRANVRLGYVECEVLRRLNQLLLEYGGALSKADKRQLRTPLVKMMRSKDWGKLCPAIPIALPRAPLERLAEMAEQTLADIHDLANDWPVSMHGEEKLLIDRTPATNH